MLITLRELLSESEYLVEVVGDVLVELLAKIDENLHGDLLNLLIVALADLEEFLHDEVSFFLDFEVDICQVQS